MNAIDTRTQVVDAGGTVSSVYGAVQLGYALVDSPRLAEWKRFGAEGIGMALADSEPGVLAFRTDSHERRLVVRDRPREDIALGLQVAGPHELDTILSRLAGHGVKVEEFAGDEAALRGVERIWRFLGPKRMALELFTEARLAADPPKLLGGGFVTGARGMGHVAITTLKYDAMIAFWREIFDARVSDFIEDKIGGVNLKFTFLRMNPRHHSIAVAATRGHAMDPFATKIQHMEMQVPTLDDVSEAYRRCRALGVKIMMAVGQHPNDRDVSFYSMSPSGFYFEVGWASKEDEDIESAPQATYQGVSLWGHKPQDQTLGDKLGQMRNAVASLFREEYAPF
jgi:2,3-dihydroxybiphenyl 1,2-dioxygenase